MKSLSIVGRHYDDFLCEALKTKGYAINFLGVDADIKRNLDNHVCLLDLRGSDCVNWVRPMIGRLGSHALILMLVEREQLKNTEITLLIGQFAWDYHTTPFELDRLCRLLGHAMGIIELKQLSRTNNKHHKLSRVRGKSQVMLDLEEQIIRVAPTEIPILIRGESGTGKELVARQIHQLSKRSHGPFIAVHCGSLVSTLVQSELFGHEKGAFTGAVRSHKGKIAQAEGGTLFLDEIGDLPIEQQINLLRFLQEGVFDTIGGTKVSTADVRIVAATHVNLEVAIDEGEFRLDLFYRLNGLTVYVPPLRLRTEDVMPLALHFAQLYAAEYSVSNCLFSEEAEQALVHHHWIGNVRELINRIRRAVLLSENGTVNANDLELSTLEVPTSRKRALKELKDEAEKHALVAAIKEHGGKMGTVATQLQISRATLYRLIDKHAICVSD